MQSHVLSTLRRHLPVWRAYGSHSAGRLGVGRRSGTTSAWRAVAVGTPSVSTLACPAVHQPLCAPHASISAPDSGSGSGSGSASPVSGGAAAGSTGIAEPSFHSIGVPSHCIGRLQRAGFATPLAVQRALVPASLADASRHVVFHAETGSGKTLAYLIPIMARLKRLPRHPHPGAIIVVPTRELAVQVEGVAAKLFAPSKKKAKHRRQALQHQPQQRGRKGGHKPGIARDVVVRRAVGRVSRRMQASFERDPPDVLVATPQTLLGLMEAGCLNLGEVHSLVLDEADMLGEPHMLPPVGQILEAFTQRKQPPQVTLVAASSSDGVEELAQRFLGAKPKVIDFTNGRYMLPQSLQHICVACSKENQLLPNITRLLANLKPEAVISFAPSAEMALKTTDYLRRKRVRVAELVGAMATKDRAAALRQVSGGIVRMLVSTDMASRGLDLPKLTHVLNLHVPSSPRQYLHRAGRVGRQGRSGTVITMATSPAEVEAMRSTATLLGVPLTVVRIKSGKIEPVPAPKA